MRRAAQCNTCKAKIFWAWTHNDRRIPVDYDHVPDGNLEITMPKSAEAEPTAFVLRDGELPLTSTRYVSHFATCPDAEQHRKNGTTT